MPLENIIPFTKNFQALSFKARAEGTPGVEKKKRENWDATTLRSTPLFLAPVAISRSHRTASLEQAKGGLKVSSFRWIFPRAKGKYRLICVVFLI